MAGGSSLWPLSPWILPMSMGQTGYSCTCAKRGSWMGLQTHCCTLDSRSSLWMCRTPMQLLQSSFGGRWPSQRLAMSLVSTHSTSPTSRRARTERKPRSSCCGVKDGLTRAAGTWTFPRQTAGCSGHTRLRSLLQQAEPGDYIAINAYLPRRADVISELQRLRVLIREHTHLATTVGFGPRFQHSTGQLHKGGPNTGLFIQIVSEQELELPIPGSSLTFGSLIRAQALGDYETLVARHRRVVRVRLARPADVSLLRRSFDEPVE